MLTWRQYDFLLILANSVSKVDEICMHILVDKLKFYKLE